MTPATRRALKARAHHLQPVVMIGDAGLTPAVLKEIDTHLKSHRWTPPVCQALNR